MNTHQFSGVSSPSARPAAVAGMFYPAAPDELRRDLGALLGAARTAGSTDRAARTAAPSGEAVRPAVLSGDAVAPKLLIVPHAGYVYSGAVAASAYARLAPLAQRVTRVVLLGPAHRVAFHGVALPGVDAFDTPLGRVPLDAQGMALAATFPQVQVNAAAHAQEHSLEVQLPFLQSVLGPFTLVPLLVGRAAPAQVAQLIEALWGGDETLVLVSSDLSHYHPYDECCRLDRDTVATIESLSPVIVHEQACGATAVNAALMCAARHGLRAATLDLRNSGDTAGPADRVVGYASIAFEAPAADAALGGALLAQARAAIAQAFGFVVDPPASLPALTAPGATFVTLTLEGHLRGCIGSLRAYRSLGEDVRANALAAAFRDPRFPPLDIRDFPRTRVEVSLLAEPVPLPVRDEAHACQVLVPHRDGVILSWGRHRATFLPQVWESIPDAAGFLRELKRKAGLQPDFWAPDLALMTYRVDKWKEGDARG